MSYPSSAVWTMHAPVSSPPVSMTVCHCSVPPASTLKTMIAAHPVFRHKAPCREDQQKAEPDHQDAEPSVYSWFHVCSLIWLLCIVHPSRWKILRLNAKLRVYLRFCRSPFSGGIPSSCTTLVLPGKLSTLYLSSKCDYDHEYDTEYDDGYEHSLQVQDNQVHDEKAHFGQGQRRQQLDGW